MEVRRHRGPPPTRAGLEARLRAEGLQPRVWSNAPGDRYGWHAHAYHKVLYCVRGSIVFHARGGDVELRAGDRLEIPPGEEHAATVGPEGVECVEAPRGPSAADRQSARDPAARRPGGRPSA